MAQNTSRKSPFYRILIIISGISFAGSTIFGLVHLFSSSLQEQPGTPHSAAASKKATLEAEAQGYELVLQREPENQVALEGLAQVRFQMDDLQGALIPLEKLVALHPDRADYKAQLTQLKQQLSKK